ncbi:Transcription factor LHW, partial [Clarias magur]
VPPYLSRYLIFWMICCWADWETAGELCFNGPASTLSPQTLCSYLVNIDYNT